MAIKKSIYYLKKQSFVRSHAAVCSEQMRLRQCLFLG